MQIKKIRKDSIVLTNAGYGVVLSVGGVHPPAVKVRIFAPFPRGEVWVKPRDVEREVNAEELAAFSAAVKAAAPDET